MYTIYIAMHIIANSFLDQSSVSLVKSDESSKKTVLYIAKEGKREKVDTYCKDGTCLVYAIIAYHD